MLSNPFKKSDDTMNSSSNLFPEFDAGATYSETMSHARELVGGILLQLLQLLWWLLLVHMGRLSWCNVFFKTLMQVPMHARSKAVPKSAVILWKKLMTKA